ncbi:alpha/beta hydrolase fold domain-containing protein [Aeromicrobium sp. CF3.5]|uniref:alpha/beta hydrolase fold domain-containing protein n=1 Tax=Aeromicrobium sp. CF3.5 TaxID=3373078 RepID=UPI003EE4D973
MALFADGYAALSGLLAPLTVRYGEDLRLAGSDLPRPERLRVPTRHGRVKVHVYRPPGIENPAVHIHLHGGAFMMRYPQMDDFFCRFVVDRARVAVVNVDYLAAPRVRYPVAQEQAHDVLVWLTQHAGEWGLDADRISIGGFSGGGNLAASACLQARDRSSAAPRLQVLGVPSLDVAGDIHGKPSTIARPMIGPGLLRLVRATYFRDVARRSEPYASPVLVDSVVGLPPSVVITAEYDSLRAEGDAYAARLSEAGVPVEHHVVPRRDHYFLDGGDPAQAGHWMGLLADRIEAALAT